MAKVPYFCLQLPNGSSLAAPMTHLLDMDPSLLEAGILSVGSPGAALARACEPSPFATPRMAARIRMNVQPCARA